VKAVIQLRMPLCAADELGKVVFLNIEVGDAPIA
jgi:hypothetical protein